jgi:hypothetical protein
MNSVLQQTNEGGMNNQAPLSNTTGSQLVSKLKELEKESQQVQIQPQPDEETQVVVPNNNTLLLQTGVNGILNAKSKGPSLDPSDFECSLCFRLFCKPVSTSCGHSYCRSCLLAALRYNLCCPLCRTKLESPSKCKYSVNITIKTLLEKHFKEGMYRQ